MSINVQAYGAPARLTLRDYQMVSTSVVPRQESAPPPAKSDHFTPSDRKSAPNAYSNVADSMRVAALRRDAAAPGVGATDRTASSVDDAAIAERPET